MRRNVATSIVRALLKSRKSLDSQEVVAQLIQFTQPLLKDQDDFEKGDEVSFSHNLLA